MRADLVLAQAGYGAGERSARLFRLAEGVAASLEASRAGEAMQAHLLAGRLVLPGERSRQTSTSSEPRGCVPLGAVGIVASIVPVNALAAVPLMLALHDALRKYGKLPGALLAAREATRGVPLPEATGHSFVALGA